MVRAAAQHRQWVMRDRQGALAIRGRVSLPTLARITPQGPFPSREEARIALDAHLAERVDGGIGRFNT